MEKNRSAQQSISQWTKPKLLRSNSAVSFGEYDGNALLKSS